MHAPSTFIPQSKLITFTILPYSLNIFTCLLLVSTNVSLEVVVLGHHRAIIWPSSSKLKLYNHALDDKI